MKRLIIEQLKEGFLFSDDNDDKYAVSSGSLSKRVHAYFGMTRPDSRKKKHIAPPGGVVSQSSSMNDKTMPRGAQGEIPAFKSLSTEQTQMQPDVGGINKGELDTSAETKALSQAKPILNKPKLGTPDNILHPSDLKLAAFEYGSDKMQQYKSLRFQELPDGRVVLRYGGARYYSTKDLVMQIPFPFLTGAFSKANGWSSSVEQAFKMYRKYLAETPGGNDGRVPPGQKSQAEINPVPQSSDSSASGVSPLEDPKGQPDGTCDDVAFDTCANNNPETCKFCMNESRYEDKRKLAARKPGKPLLRARWEA